jgi:hypothetical protein
MMFSTDDGTVNEGHAAGQLQSKKKNKKLKTTEKLFQ